MPKIKGRVLAIKMIDGKMIATIQCNEKVPKISEIVSIKWGSTRTLAQNALYWVYLNWLINEGGLKDQGHFSPDALHLDLKTHFLAEKIMTKGQFVAVEEPTTTLMDKSSFGEYFDKCDQFVQEFFDISTSAFWEEYKQNQEWKV